MFRNSADLLKQVEENLTLNIEMLDEASIIFQQALDYAKLPDPSSPLCVIGSRNMAGKSIILNPQSTMLSALQAAPDGSKLRILLRHRDEHLVLSLLTVIADAVVGTKYPDISRTPTFIPFNAIDTLEID
jgi:hypothetical protein